LPSFFVIQEVRFDRIVFERGWPLPPRSGERFVERSRDGLAFLVELGWLPRRRQIVRARGRDRSQF
jgi:hypothetical protein